MRARAAFRLRFGLLLGAAACALGGMAHAQTVEQLRSMSITDLAKIEVSSVSKSAEPLSEAPAAIYVITHEAIARSGASTLPEILRLAPNLQVHQTSAAAYTITARGLAGDPEAQAFSNKLLVLIDGRSVYTPLYSGVYWDMQDVVLDDVDRIEVISGPGATLWGANAVNGVINIITRKTSDTQGLLADVEAGDQEQAVNLRYGGAIGSNANYRLYVKAIQDEAFDRAAGGSSLDQWRRLQGGFRVDWAPAPRDAISLHGDAFAGTTGHPANDERIAGRNLTARWRHATGAGDDAGALQVQLYYDHTMRADRTTGRLVFDSYDVDVQHDFSLGGAQHIVWGGGARASHYVIDSISGLTFSPPSRTLFLGNVFVQDSIAIGKAATLVIGAKAEDDPYVGVSFLPSIRGSVKLGVGTTLWAAVSRAIRSPTPFDRDVVETIGGAVFLAADADFRTEKLTAYETGLRTRLGGIASLSVSGFYNVYDDLRSIELSPAGSLPLRWGNRINARTWGAEVEATVKPAPWWRLTAGYNYLHENVTFDPDASRLLGTAQIGDDPHHQASLRSSFDLGAITLDGTLRYVGPRPDPVVPAYTEVDAQIGWRVSPHLLLSVTGTNLLHASHIEYAGGERVPRSVLFGVRWQR
jgi:iron complex outermembrane receptor protein